MLSLIAMGAGAAAFGGLGYASANAANDDIRRQNREAQADLTESQRRLRLVENDQRSALYGQQVRQLGEIQNVAGTSRGMDRVIRNAMARGRKDRDALVESFDQRQENIQTQKENVARQLGSQLQSPLTSTIMGATQGMSIGGAIGGSIQGAIDANNQGEAIPQSPGPDATPEQQIEFMASLDAMRAGVPSDQISPDTLAPFIQQRQNQMMQFESGQSINAIQLELLQMQKAHQQWQYQQAKQLFGGR